MTKQEQEYRKAAIERYGDDPHSFAQQRDGFIEGCKHASKWIPIEEFQKERTHGKRLWMSDGHVLRLGYMDGAAFRTLDTGFFFPKRVIILPEDPENEKP
jgi:hypothetical protein